MFSYNTSISQKFETSPPFVIFGQHSRQPALNHGNWEKVIAQSEKGSDYVDVIGLVGGGHYLELVQSGLDAVWDELESQVTASIHSVSIWSSAHPEFPNACHDL
jgi:hypothetical protein